jgi:hypothetical protein
MNFFAGCESLEQLKKRYKELILKHHPDVGGDNATMARINGEYETEFKRLQKVSKNKAEQNEGINEYREIIVKLLKLSGITIEICGAWLWVSGNTKPHKEVFKALKCMWSPKKTMWYWRPEEAACHSRGRGQDMATIRAKYGSHILHAPDPEKLPA